MGFEELAGLKQLTFLNLFFENPNLVVIGQMRSLENLHLERIGISDTSELSRLHKLEELHLSGNGIEDISGLGTLRNLEYLNLADNRISDLGPLSNLRNLRQLYLPFNAVEDISAVSGLPLISLNIHANQGSDISALATLEHREPPSGLADQFNLTASDNLIRDISSLSAIVRPWVRFTLDNNQIAEIGDAFSITNAFVIARRCVEKSPCVATRSCAQKLNATWKSSRDSLAPACRRHVFLRVLVAIWKSMGFDS